MKDTIYALASGAGRAGVAVMRLSGPRTLDALHALAGGPPPPRRASLRRLRDADGAVLDEALVLWFPGPASFTGEDMAELHLHGGPAILAAVSEALNTLGLRPAEPGDFSRRAFAHGKLDLTQAEAIADLVDAETEAQRTQALRQLGGALGGLYEGWRTQLIAAMALIEAEIDFPDEGDVQDAHDAASGLASRAGAALHALAADMRAHLDDAHRGERIRDGFHVAIIGAPNAGKSTLLNALAGRDAAIVTDIPGTTRDIVEARLVLDGFLVVLADTAGLRDTADPVEREGVARAKRRAEEADLRVLVVDAALGAEALAADFAAVSHLMQAGDILALNKMDSAEDGAGRTDGAPEGVEALRLAAREGQGVSDLITLVSARVRARLAASEAPSLTRARHRKALEEAVEALDAALAHAAHAPELAGERARQAALAIGRITGRVDVEDILDRVFADFCIGK